MYDQMKQDILKQSNNDEINSIYKKNNVKISGTQFYWIFKRIFDISVSLSLLPLLIFITLCIFLCNFIFNPGSIFFVQERMGKDCKLFRAIKFRSMRTTKLIERNYDDPVETDRIPPFGKLLRKSRIDELPQILNVLQGEMSLIGPRPDYYEHAKVYLDTIHNYRDRHVIRPGITGLSQIRLGYAEGLKATMQKSTMDNYYINNTNFMMDTKILFGTIYIILAQLGS
jgi:lipopolysaccharide/colanic/teichoic acid biosynthesis glycosyltransferase